MSNCIFIRHFPDKEKLTTPGRDNPITRAEKADICALFQALEHSTRLRNFNNLRIISSNRLRCIQTKEILVKGVKSFMPHLNLDIHVDYRINDMKHGEYYNHPYSPIISDQKKYDMAWKVFIQETFMNKNINYHHGSPVVKGELCARYPQLETIIRTPGESQLEVSLRLYEFLLNLVEESFFSQIGKPIVVITHSLIIFRIYEILEVFKRYANRPIKLGELIFKEWDIDIKKIEEVLVTPPYILNLDMFPLLKNIQRLRLERDYLLQRAIIKL